MAAKLSEQMARQLGLRDNQIVRGVIESRGDLMKLILNNREIDWTGSRRFRAGDKLDLRVVMTDRGANLVPVTLSSDSESSQVVLSERLLQLFYRPRQEAALIGLFNPKSLALLLSKTGSASLGKTLGPLLNSMGSLTPAAVKRALRDSGLFTENRLAKKLPLKQDIKVFLRNLLRAAALQNQTQQVSDIQGAIDQLESRQLESLQAQSNRELSYSFLLPFADAEPVDVKFSRAAGATPEAAAWIIDLYTDSQLLGQLWLKTRVSSAGQLDMMVWVERQQSAQLARSAMAELKYELEAFGLQLAEFKVLNSPRPLPDQQFNSPGDMVDICT